MENDKIRYTEYDFRGRQKAPQRTAIGLKRRHIPNRENGWTILLQHSRPKQERGYNPMFRKIISIAMAERKM